LHNGVHPLDGAVELIKYMYEKKKKLIVLSNTSAPSKNALQRLDQLGFPQKYFIDAITSGEEASRYVRMTYGVQPRITKVIFLTWDVRIPNNPRLTALPQAFLDACCAVDTDDNHTNKNIQVTGNISEADLVLLHGSEVWYRGTDVEPVSLGSFIETGNCADVIDPLLQQFIHYNLPLICANPDEIVVTPTNGKAYMPGRILKRYQELGGTNGRQFGKPNVEHFEACLRQLQYCSDGTVTKDRVAHVGDSLHHDILGANRAHIPSIFITSGIHASQLSDSGAPIDGTSSNDDNDNQHQRLCHLFEAEGSIYPTHVVPAFRL
jgi:ribonucleotide monophosphatase NagD (HAD superfamily)